jgi:hypothetical protein
VQCCIDCIPIHSQEIKAFIILIFSADADVLNEYNAFVVALVKTDVSEEHRVHDQGDKNRRPRRSLQLASVASYC